MRVYSRTTFLHSQFAFEDNGLLAFLSNVSPRTHRRICSPRQTKYEVKTEVTDGKSTFSWVQAGAVPVWFFAGGVE